MRRRQASGALSPQPGSRRCVVGDDGLQAIWEWSQYNDTPGAGNAVWHPNEDALLLESTSRNELRALVNEKGTKAVRTRLEYLA